MSARRACGSHAPSFIGCRVCGSSSPTASQFMPGRHSACRGKLGLPLSRKILPLTLRQAPVWPSWRYSACLPSVRYSGSRYFSHSAGGSTTWLSPSNTTKSLVIICCSYYAAPSGFDTLIEKSDAGNLTRLSPRLERLFRFFERRREPALQYGLGVDMSEVFDQTGNDTRPPGLVTGADAGPVVAMEVLVEQQVVAPIGIALKFFGAAKDRAPAGFVTQKDPRQATGDLLRHLEQVHQPARPGRALDFEVVSVVGEVMHQGADDQRVDRHPDRPAPVELPPNIPLSDS